MFIRLFFLIYFITLLPVIGLAQSILFQKTLPVQEEQHLVISIPKAGKYAIKVKSKQGTRITLVDHMAGDLGNSGTTSSHDGRINKFLDAGKYKIRIYGVKKEKGFGKIQLFVFSYHEKKSATPTVLKQYKIYTTALEDLQQVSYWIQWNKNKTFRLEAQGRSLDSCSLWLNGEWIHNITPTKFTRTPEKGRPVRYIEFHKRLSSGLYRLTCYGGEKKKWAYEDKKSSKFHLRLGIPRLGKNGRIDFKVSPFGSDIFQIEKGTNFVQFGQLEKKNVSIAMKYHNNSSSIHSRSSFTSLKIHPKLRTPYVTKSGYYTKKYYSRWVVIKAKPKTSVSFVYLEKQSSSYNKHLYSGQYLVSTISSLEGDDSIDLSGEIKKYYGGDQLAKQLIQLSRINKLERKINISKYSRTNFLVAIQSSGFYQYTESSKLEGSAKLEVYVHEGSRRNSTVRVSGSGVYLARGIYRFSLYGLKTGILDFKIRHTGMIERVQKNVPKQKGITWTDLSVTKIGSYKFKFNRRSNVTNGISVYRYPIRLETVPVSIFLAPGESKNFEVKILNKSLPAVHSSNNVPSQISVYGRNLLPYEPLIKGTYSIKIKNTGTRSSFYSISTDEYLPISQTTLTSELRKEQRRINQAPVLNAKKSIYMHFDRSDEKFFQVAVKKPALYELQTEGRLNTSILLQTKVFPNFASSSGNGSGRNGRIFRYLKTGVYLLSVRTQGRSKGYLRIRLKQSPLKTRSTIQAGEIRKYTLSSGTVIRFPVSIPKTAEYTMDTIGIQKHFRFRLEDNKGWPIYYKPNTHGLFKRVLKKGKYFYYSLPTSYKTRRITYLNIKKIEKKFTGKGLHQIRTSKKYSHIWMEDKKRTPDTYQFVVTAPSPFTVELSKGMRATLLNEKGEVFDHFVGKKKWDKPLSMGKWKLQVSAIEKQDFFSYTLNVYTADWVPGDSFDFSNYAKPLTLHLGKDSLVDLKSFGTIDVKAKLTSLDGKTVIAQSDDSYNDWNFYISQYLKKGSYKLHIEKESNQSSQSTKFTFNVRESGENSTQRQPFPFQVLSQKTKSIHKTTFRTHSQNQVVAFVTPEKEATYFSLSKNGKEIAKAKGELIIGLHANTEYTLSIWKEGSFSTPIQAKSKFLYSLAKIPSIDKYTLLAGIKHQIYQITQSTKQFYSTNSNRFCTFIRFEEPCKSSPHEFFSLPTSGGWVILQDLHSSFIIEPAKLINGKTQNFPLGQTPIGIDFRKSSQQKLSFIEISSAGKAVAGMPILQNLNQFNWNSFYTIGSKTWFAIPPKQTTRGKIWNPRKSQFSQNIQATLYSFPYTKKSFQKIQGISNSLGKKSAVWIQGNPNQSNKILLSPEMVALVWKDGKIQKVVATSKNSQQLIIPSGDIIIWNRGSIDSSFRIQKTQKIKQTTLQNKSFEQWFPNSGRFEVQISGSFASTEQIFVDGEFTKYEFLTKTGQIKTFTKSQPIPAQTGRLIIHHKQGGLKVWVSSLKETNQTFWGSKIPKQNGLINGERMIQGNLQSWNFQLEKTTWVQIKKSSHGIMAISNGKKILTTTHGAQPQIGYLLPAGNYQVWTRAYQGEAQGGVLSWRGFQPVLVKEGVLKPYFIGSNETQVFFFQVKGKANVGVGIRATADFLQGALYNKKMKLLEKGNLVFQTLKKGEYFFLVKNPTKQPIRYTPIVAGTKGERLGIPQNIIRKYLKK